MASEIPPPAIGVRLDLELASDADPIQGVVRAPDAEPRPFTGWLALIAALDEMRGADPG
jgi:hypothetical protein